MRQNWINFFGNAKQEAAGRRAGQPVAYPYQWGPRTLAPAINPPVGASLPEIVFIRLHGLNFSTGAPRADMKFEVVDAAGKAVEVKPRALIDKRQDAKAGTYDMVLQFGIGAMGLEPGQYRLRLKIKDALGGGEAAADTPFVVPEG